MYGTNIWVIERGGSAGLEQETTFCALVTDQVRWQKLERDHSGPNARREPCTPIPSSRRRAGPAPRIARLGDRSIRRRRCASATALELRAWSPRYPPSRRAHDLG